MISILRQISNLVFSEKFGTRSFNLDIHERAECMEKLFSGSPFDETGKPESVVNIVARFEDIADSFPGELLDPKTLPYFADWLMENVYLVEITAYSDADAYTIFETMNDRGLSLTPTDMLKGYLLANITDAQLRSQANRMWRERIESLRELGREKMRTVSKIGFGASTQRPCVTEDKGLSPATLILSAPSSTGGCATTKKTSRLTTAPTSEGLLATTLNSTATGTNAFAGLPKH